MNSSFVHQSLRPNLAATAVALLIAMPAFGDLTTIFSDNFDSYATGLAPAGPWVDKNNGTGDALVSSAQSVSGPNSLHVLGTNALAENLEIQFPGVQVPTDPANPMRLSFDLLVVTQGASGGLLQPGGIDTVNSSPPDYHGNWSFTAQWSQFIDQSKFVLTPGFDQFDTGVWHHVEFDFTRTSTFNGVFTKYVDGIQYGGATAYDTFAEFGGTTRALLSFIDLQNGSADNTDFYMDNLLITVPEPSTLLLLGAGGWLLWRARNRRRA